MADVAHDGDTQILKAVLSLAHRERIQKPLRGVGNVRFAGGQHADMRRHVARDEPEHPDLGLADDEHIGVQRLQGVDGIEHALALGARGQLQLDVHHVGAEPPASQLEGYARARRWLGKQVRDRDAPQPLGARRRQVKAASVVLRACEQGLDLVGSQTIERNQVPQRAIGSPLINRPARCHRAPAAC